MKFYKAVEMDLTEMQAEIRAFEKLDNPQEWERKQMQLLLVECEKEAKQRGLWAATLSCPYGLLHVRLGTYQMREWDIRQVESYAQEYTRTDDFVGYGGRMTRAEWLKYQLRFLGKEKTDVVTVTCQYGIKLFPVTIYAKGQ